MSFNEKNEQKRIQKSPMLFIFMVIFTFRVSSLHDRIPCSHLYSHPLTPGCAMPSTKLICIWTIEKLMQRDAYLANDAAIHKFLQIILFFLLFPSLFLSFFPVSPYGRQLTDEEDSTGMRVHVCVNLFFTVILISRSFQQQKQTTTIIVHVQCSFCGIHGVLNLLHLPTLAQFTYCILFYLVIYPKNRTIDCCCINKKIFKISINKPANFSNLLNFNWLTVIFEKFSPVRIWINMNKKLNCTVFVW